MGDIDDDVYTTTIEVIQEKLAKIEVEIAKVKKKLSNLTATADEVVATCCKLGCLWSSSELELSQKIQNLLFPSGILWDKEIGNYRTIDENYALNIIHNISISYENKKEGELENSPSKKILSGKRDSNPRPSAWEANALPTELLPRCCISLRRYNIYFNVGCSFAILAHRQPLFYFGNASPRSSTSTALSTVLSLRLMYLTCSHMPSRWYVTFE